jgi:hypothetical protein
MVRIIEVDPRDEAGLRAFHDTEQAAIRHDRPDAVIRTWPALLTIAQTPGPYYRRTWGFRVVERMHEMQRKDA